MTDLPIAIYEGFIQVGSVTLRTYVLDDGRRIVNADDLAAMQAAWSRGERFTEEEATALAEFVTGRMPL